MVLRRKIDSELLTTISHDSSNNRIGINDTTPSEALDVTGNIGVSGNVDGVDVSAIPTTYLAKTGDTMTGNLSITKDSPILYIRGDAGNNDLVFRDGITDKAAITWDRVNDKITITHGGVGIDINAGNISMAALKTVDGVDVSAHAVATTGVHGAAANTLLHTGNRDVNSGVAGLSGAGDVLALGNAIMLTRNGSNQTKITERTSSEDIVRLDRISANDYDVFIFEGGVAKQIQTEAMKNVANGIAGLDASGDVPLAQLAGITNAEIAAGAAIAASKLSGVEATTNKNAASGYAGLDTNRDIPHIRPKAASANLRHSHDAEVIDSTAYPTYAKLKTITFANGISGTLRISFEIHAETSGTARGRIYKNGEALGTEQSETSYTYVTKTEDINVGIIAPGGTIELWGNGAFSRVFVQNLRISYDNAADTVLVGGVSNS